MCCATYDGWAISQYLKHVFEGYLNIQIAQIGWRSLVGPSRGQDISGLGMRRP